MNAAVICLREERRRQRDVLKSLLNDMALKNEDGAYYVRLVRQVRRELKELDAALALLTASPDTTVPQEPRIPAPVAPSPPVPGPAHPKPVPGLPAPPPPMVGVDAVAAPAVVNPVGAPRARTPPRRDVGLVRRVAL